MITIFVDTFACHLVVPWLRSWVRDNGLHTHRFPIILIFQLWSIKLWAVSLLLRNLEINALICDWMDTYWFLINIIAIISVNVVNINFKHCFDRITVLIAGNILDFLVFMGVVGVFNNVFVDCLLLNDKGRRLLFLEICLFLLVGLIHVILLDVWSVGDTKRFFIRIVLFDCLDLPIKR